MDRVRVNGRSSLKINDFKKYTYSRYHAYKRACSGNQQSIKSKSIKQSPDKSILQFPTPDDLSECSLMKVFQQGVDPVLKKLVDYITERKMYSGTLETYALIQGRTSEWLEKHFTDEQINTIRQNPDCGNFDLTLKINCIERFKDFNQTVNGNEKLNQNIVATLKNLKGIRNNLFHNRDHYTELQCHNLANNLKVFVAELLEIIHTWDKGMDIFTEKKETETLISKIMIGGISEEDLRYMGLRKVINSVAESALNKVTQLFCSEKKKGNFKKYFLDNGMTSSKYKNYFNREEKKILESDTDDIRMDVTLHTKVIEACKDWDHSLRDDFPAKEELYSIIKNIRGIRNNVSHNMLSMSPVECRTEANGLREHLKDLTNFIQRKMINMDEDAHLLDINQIYHDIDWIMSVPYPPIGF